MEKKLLASAIAVVATAVAMPASALNVYEEGGTKFDVSGRVAVRIEMGGDETILRNSSSRIRFAFEQDLVGDWMASARAEWGFDPVFEGGGDGLFNNRLGSVSIGHESIGKFTFGKDWSSYYDITGWTDVLWVYGGSASGTYDQNETSRTTDSLIYRNSFGDFSVSAQYGFFDAGVNRDSNWQLAGWYDMDMGLSLGGTYSSTSAVVGEDREAFNLGAKYSSDMIYVAGTVGQFSDHVYAGDALGFELVGFYYIQNTDFEVYGGYNSVTADDNDGELSYFSLGAAWTPGTLVLAIEGQLGTTDKNEIGVDTADDIVALLARYNF